ncbi:hypothetical protein [Nocardia tenerifensis]|nr:hypothetical protein [Nocardia tenerifensis]
MGSDAKFAVRDLYDQLDRGFEDSQELFGGYIFTKRILADFMQALIRSQISASDISRYNNILATVETLLADAYVGKMPEKYLKVPYRSAIHAELYAVLYRRRGEPVEADLLRIITADSVHTERRTRELRELGLDIVASKSGAVNTYTLQSLEINPSKLGSIVANHIRADKSLSVSARDRLLSRL